MKVDYQFRESGWYLEYSGFLLQRDQENEESPDTKIYILRELNGAYDLNV